MHETAPQAIPPRQVTDANQSGAGNLRMGYLSLLGLILVATLTFPLLAALALWSTGMLKDWDQAMILFFGLLIVPIVIIEGTIDLGAFTLFMYGLFTWLVLAMPGMFIGRLIRRRSHLFLLLAIMAAISCVQVFMGMALLS